MITKVIFVVALIMPNGEYITKSSVVEACPSIKQVGDHYERRIRSDASWEERAIESSANSIKDELWTCAFILLIGAAMIPDLQPYIKEGFRVLKDDCPEWLSWGILASIAASFGLKSIGQFKK
tara:strand:+ start:75 stop:443 length:369 start_codon:yes stop_codon:yes gene_type:complete